MSDEPSKGPPRRSALQSPPPPTDTDVSPRPFALLRPQQLQSTPVRDSPLRERVSFFEHHIDRQRVLTPSTSREDLLSPSVSTDETRRRTVTMSEGGRPRTPGTVFRESYESIREEGDGPTGSKIVRVDRVTLTKTVKEVPMSQQRRVSSSVHSSNSSLASPMKEMSPQPEEQDSAYRTRGLSKSSSISSMVSSWGTGRYTSQESLLGMSGASGDQLDRTTSRATDSSDYRHQPFQTIAARMKQIRSKAEYDSHIADIKGERRIFFANIFDKPTDDHRLN
jgi:hypothetical protein